MQDGADRRLRSNTSVSPWRGHLSWPYAVWNARSVRRVAGSERRESLLPGELEFSDQDDYGLEGPSVVKVAPPSDFDLLGSKYEQQPAEIQAQDTVTPSLPQNDGLAALGITPEQLLYLQLLQNPWAAAFGGAFNKPQVFILTVHQAFDVIQILSIGQLPLLRISFIANRRLLYHECLCNNTLVCPRSLLRALPSSQPSPLSRQVSSR